MTPAAFAAEIRRQHPNPVNCRACGRWFSRGDAPAGVAVIACDAEECRAWEEGYRAGLQAH